VTTTLDQPRTHPVTSPFDQLRAERLRHERRARRLGSLILVLAMLVVTLVGVVWFKSVRDGATPKPHASSRAIKARVPPAPPSSTPPSDTTIEQTLQDATGLAASLLASTRSTEVARSALVAAQEITECAPKEGGPALVHLDDRIERAAELASRADFYSAARDDGREYATHAHAYVDRRTVVHVAVAWECS
jgi:hypothetical protein